MWRTRESARGRAATPVIYGRTASLPVDLLRRLVAPGRSGLRILDVALRRLGLSARAHDAILRVAQTITDLEGADRVESPHVAEAIQYRALDRSRGQEAPDDELPPTN